MDDLEEAAATVSILIREELEIRHRLEGHATPVAGCPVCDSRR